MSPSPVLRLEESISVAGPILLETATRFLCVLLQSELEVANFEVTVTVMLRILFFLDLTQCSGKVSTSTCYLWPGTYRPQKMKALRLFETSEYVRLHAAQRNGPEEQTVEVADILKLWVKIDSFSVVYSSDVIHIRHTPWLTLAAFLY
jgi:hypothetical protein